ncbi:FtsX-like permease family protein [Treponema sp.]
MYQALRIAVRNVARQKKRSILLGSAVAFGFLIITLMNGFTSGLIATVKENFSHAFGGHLYFSGSIISDRGSELALIQDQGAALSAIAALGDRVESVYRRSRGSGILYFGSKQEAQRIEGVDFADERKFSEQLDISSGSLADLSKPGALVLPEDTVKKLGVALGEMLIFKVSTISGQQNVGEFVLVATTKSGLSMGGSSAYADKETLNALIGLSPEQFQTINVYLKDINKSGVASKIAYAELKRNGPVETKDVKEDGASHLNSMRRMMGGGALKSIAVNEQWEGTKFTLTTIEDMMAPLLSLVATLNMVSFGVFIVLLVIIMVGILNSYRMVMIERTQEIGTMRALGMQKNGIRNIFLWEALSITIAGAFSGFLLALAIMGLSSLINLSGASFFSFFLSKGHLVFKVPPLDSLKNFLILSLMSLAAVYLPARTASRLKPAEALRSSY